MQKKPFIPVGVASPTRSASKWLSQPGRGGDAAPTKALINQLLRAAKAAQRKAYAPYSKFPVGAALLTQSGKIYTGCNVENASYGLSICAERVAATKAVSEGHQKFQAITIVAHHPNLTPCGACRQFLSEFGNLTIICADSRNVSKVRIFSLAELLPHAFEL